MRRAHWLPEAARQLLEPAAEARAAGSFPFFRRFSSIGPRVQIDGQRYVNFTSNDYLGLSQDAEVKAAAAAGIARFGTGLGSSRLQATTVRHVELEERLADWLGFPACAVFPSGYQALVGVLSALLDDAWLAALDNQSHASMLDGVYLAKGHHPELEERFFRHNSAAGLRRIFAGSERRHRLAAVEGLYSVDGDIAPLADMAAICAEHGAVLLVDDAHGIGALGPRGRGAAELEGALGSVDVLVGTFSKVFGGAGGFVCAEREVVEYLALAARSFVYSASLPLPQVEGALAALGRVQGDPDLRARLAHNTAFFRAGLAQLGCDVGTSTTHICPIMVGDERRAMAFGAELFAAGVIMLPFVYPGVPLGQARLRCNVTAAHGEADMVQALEAVSRIGRRLGVLPAAAEAP